MLNASCQCTEPWNSQAHAVASNTVRDLLFRLFLVETSCLGQIQHLFNLSFFMIIVAVFSFFSSFYSYKTFFVRVPILKDYPHTPQTFGMQTRQRWSLFPSRNNIFSLVFFDSFYLKLKIF